MRPRVPFSSCFFWSLFVQARTAFSRSRCGEFIFHLFPFVGMGTNENGILAYNAHLRCSFDLNIMKVYRLHSRIVVNNKSDKIFDEVGNAKSS
jgi:hypothetical protein